jgi:hypothetical protein
MAVTAARSLSRIAQPTDADLLRCVEKNPDESGPCGEVPAGQRQPALAGQTRRIGYRLLRPAEVRQSQVADDRVEATIREGERLCVTLPEVGPRKALPGDPDRGSAMSTPTAVAPRSAACREMTRPQAMSRTRASGPASTESSSASLRRLVRAGQ